MTLYNICKMIANVEEGLLYGSIRYSYDNLMCTLKPGHPADILDEILSIIGWDVFAGKTPEDEKVKQMNSFCNAQKFTQPSTPILWLG